MAQSAPLSPTTILIVEHEGLIRLELRSRLVEWGHTVLEASDADDAIAVLDTHPEVEILVTDVKMPGSMDGIRLAHHVRGRWPPVAIIVSSGLGEAELGDLPKGSSLMPKPYGPDILAGVLAQFANRDRANRTARDSGSAR